MKIHLHHKKYKSKPKKYEISKISTEITNKIKEIDVERFAREVGEKGRTFTAAIFDGRRTKENFVSQQVFALDFDEGFSIERFWERAERFSIHPSVIYDTFSSTKQCPKFRVVFVNDCEIQDGEAASMLIQMLQYIYPESDKSCKDVTRMFFGGKKLRFVNADATINLLDISLSLQAYLKSEDSKNYSRKIQSIGKKLNIRVEDGMLRIHRAVPSDEKSEDLLETTNNIIRVNAQNSSLFYIIEKSTDLHFESRRTNEKLSKVRGITKEILMKNCQLFKDFYEDIIEHDLKFLIATNLLHISGGKELFFGGNIEHIEKWEMDWKYLKIHEYKPERCEKGNCPYYEKCRSPTILDRVSSKIIEKGIDVFIERDKAEKILRDYMLKAVNAEEKGIYLISAQTALGKTHAYCEILKKYHEKIPFMIAVPTTQLQREVGEKLERMGVPVFLTENIYLLLQELHLDDLKDEVIDLYKKGFGLKVRSIIKEYMKNAEINEIQYSRLESFLKAKEKLDGSKCVVTTHALFLTLPEEILSQYEVIIDEDILMTIFKNTGSISFKDIETALEKGAIPNNCCIRQLLQDDDITVKVENPLRLQTAQIEEIYRKKLGIETSITDFLQADTYHVDMQNKRVDFFNAKRLPDIKMTIVSATLNEELYKSYCIGKKIGMMHVPTAEYKGKLTQYTAHSLSRSNLDDIGIERVKEYADRLVGDKEKNIITFKKYTENSGIYFGKSEGYNEYQGKDLIVIGTPHNVPFIYQLIGAYLGYDEKDKLCIRMTENDRFSFKFMTYKNEQMKNLQFYFIESELEQAIGRARLLRYDCNVYLFSNYPCSQAIIIQDEYLEEGK